MDEAAALIGAYFKQQMNMETPAYIFSDSFDAGAFLYEDSRKKTPPPKAVYVPAASSTALGSSRVKPIVTKSQSLPLPALKLGLIPARRSFTEEVDAAPTEKRSKLAALFHEVKTCRECGLAKDRKNLVFGTGNPDAPLLIIGEPPGREEDEQGLPFVGLAGELLTKMLAAISLDRKKQAFITGIIKCKPQPERDPDDGVINACSKILSRQIDIIAPKVILVLGKQACGALLKLNEPIAQLRLRRHAYQGIPVFVTYHPAALLHNDSYRRPAWEDLKILKTTVQEIGLYDLPTR